MEAVVPDLSPIIDLMKKHSGIKFAKEKSYVILTKIYPLLKKYNLKDAEALIEVVKKNIDSKLISELVDVLTINETSFYRDRYPFEALDKFILPKILENDPTKKMIKILCAACSTGQEPYSLIMHFLEQKQHKLIPQITAVDLSSIVLDRARAGVFNQFEVQRGLPITMLVKYFAQNGKDWHIKEEVKKHVVFKKFNLKDNLSVLGRFDLIFCRNVLIYFDEDLRKQVINNLIKIMNPQASLILGATESVGWGENPELSKVSDYSGIYSL